MFLERRFDEIVDRDERIKFVLAGYNAGPGHVRDAVIAAKYVVSAVCYEGLMPRSPMRTISRVAHPIWRLRRGLEI